MTRIVLQAVVAALLAALAGPAPAPAQKIDLAGQKVTLAISTPSGGGYDLYGRLVARYLGRYLPGNPTIVPQNMPGAGSLLAANWHANFASRDGTGLAIIPSATLFENLLGNASARFDARKLNWLVSLNDYTAVAAAARHAVRDRRGPVYAEFLVGSNAPSSDDHLAALLNAGRHQDQAGARLSGHRRHRSPWSAARSRPSATTGRLKANKAQWLARRRSAS